MSGHSNQPPSDPDDDDVSRMIGEIHEHHRLSASDPTLAVSSDLLQALHAYQRIREAAINAAYSLRSMPPGRRDPARVNRLLNEVSFQELPNPNLTPVGPPSPPRPTASSPPISSRPARYRIMAESRRAAAASLARVQVHAESNRSEADRRLEHIRNRILDGTDPSAALSARRNTLREAPGDGDSNHRAKRRKLDSDNLDKGFPGFSYGRYGQVESGKLTMEIVSCDGGTISEEGGRSYPGDYSAENILRNDDTVYCTKTNRCNIVLRHQGATPFSLKELIIKAPRSGYTAPVQEGMVFISMTSDDLLTRTAQYQIQYAPPTGRSPTRANGSAEGIAPYSIHHIHNEESARSAGRASARRLYDMGVQDEECGYRPVQVYRPAQIPSDFAMADPPLFHVTTECSEDESDRSPNRSRWARVTSHLRSSGLSFEPSDDEDSDTMPTRRRQPILRRTRTSYHSRRDSPSQITLAEAEEAAQAATQDAVRAVGGELMAPHARFFIERDKSKCTVKFDPPVSGRFILLKLFSPADDPNGNIDIRSVVAKGFAGPRLFPAVDLR